MNTIFNLQLALVLLSFNNYITSMHIVPALTQKSLFKRQCSLIINSKKPYTQEDKMAYYKQFCTSIDIPNNKLSTQQTQTFTLNSSNSQEDKMAYYKQFSTTQ